MKLAQGTLERLNDGRYHQCCIACGVEALERVVLGEREHWRCGACGVTSARSLIVDPRVSWWVADDGEYWHETGGVFVRNRDGAFLLFERVKFPFGLTVPAGHVETGEAPEVCARRELLEEVGVQADRLVRLGSDDILGGGCRRGCDAHRWHSFGLVLVEPVEVTVADEGARPVWLSLDEAMMADLTDATRWVMSRYAARLQTM